MIRQDSLPTVREKALETSGLKKIATKSTLHRCICVRKRVPFVLCASTDLEKYASPATYHNAPKVVAASPRHPVCPDAFTTSPRTGRSLLCSSSRDRDRSVASISTSPSGTTPTISVRKRIAVICRNADVKQRRMQRLASTICWLRKRSNKVSNPHPSSRGALGGGSVCRLGYAIKRRSKITVGTYVVVVCQAASYPSSSVWQL